eukprot:m.88012 g.88012  ORF g.88012 m.88012 type:complete len:585 (-) comp15157_c0_seq1:214-1968(-)
MNDDPKRLPSDEAHFAEVRGHLKGGSGGSLDVVHCEALGNLDELQALLGVHVEDSLLRDDAVDTAAAGERQLALGQDLLHIALGVVLHGDDDLGARAGDEVHGAAHALDHLAGDHPVGQVAVLRNLHGAQDGEVNVAAADHGKGVVAAEERAAGQDGDGLLAGVDQVSVLFARLGEGAKAQDAVLAVQDDVHALGDKVAGQHGHTNAEVGVHAVLKLEGGAAHNLLAHVDVGGTLLAGRGRTAFLGEGQALDALLEVRRLDDALDEEAWHMDLVRVKGADLDNLLHLGDGDLGGAGHRRVEVACRLAEDQVAGLVGLPCPDQGKVARDGLLHDIVDAVELLGRPRLGGNLNALAVLLVLDGRPALLDDCAEGGRGEEGRDAGAARADALGECALRRELDLQLAGQVLALKLGVLADVRRNHALDLARADQLAEAEVVDAGVVADGGQALDATVAQGRDEVLGDAAETEAAHEDAGAVLDALEGLLRRAADAQAALGTRAGQALQDDDLAGRGRGGAEKASQQHVLRGDSVTHASLQPKEKAEKLHDAGKVTGCCSVLPEQEWEQGLGGAVIGVGIAVWLSWRLD